MAREMEASAYCPGGDNKYWEVDSNGVKHLVADGSTDTSSSIPISAHQYTVASADGLPLGTVYKVTNEEITLSDGTHPSIVTVKTDRAGRDKIDLVAGVNTVALGMHPTTGKNGDVISLTNSEHITVEALGTINLDDKEKAGSETSISQFQTLSHEINTGQKSVSDLASISSFKPSGDFDKSKDTKLSSLADPTKIAIHTAAANKPKYRNPGHLSTKDRQKENDDYADSVNDLVQSGEMPQQDALVIFFAMMIFGMLSGKGLDDTLSMFSKITGRDPQDISEHVPDGSKRKEFSQAPAIAPTVWQEAWNNGHSDKSATQNLLNAVPEARDAVAKSNSKLAIYQELKGTGNHTFGVMVFKDTNGNVTCVPQAGGGAGGHDSLPGASTGTGAGTIDPRYPDAKAIPDYQLGWFRQRDDNLGKFSFDLRSDGKDYVENTGRSAIRVHVGTNGSSSSLGCQHVSGKDGDYVANELGALTKDGPMTYHIMPSLDDKNVLVQEAAKANPQKAITEAKDATSTAPKQASASLDKQHEFADLIAQHQQRLADAKQAAATDGYPPVALADVRSKEIKADINKNAASLV